MKHRYLLLSLLFIPSALFAQPARMTFAGTYKSGLYELGGAEIVTYDAATRRIFVVNASSNQVDILNAAYPARLEKIETISYATWGAGVNSVAVKNGLIAAAVEANPRTNPGKVVVHTISGEFRGEATVGALPDMITFNGDGTILLTANEGEPDGDYSIDPEGSVSIIRVSNGGRDLQVTTAGFADFNVGGARRSEIDTTKVRVYGKGANVARDLEPEYITVTGDSAFVSIQEANAVGLLRISTGTWTWIKSLGLKDHSLRGNGLDASDREVSSSRGRINIANWPVFGMYQPDAIASFTSGGQVFFATANEGDSRNYAPAFNEEVAVGNSSYVLDPARFPNATSLKAAASLGRLIVTNKTGDIDGDGDFDEIHVLGARSFSIFDAAANLVFDSGDQFEQITAAAYPVNFNASNTSNTLDNRSDNKGPEPEAIAVGMVGDSLYAFIGLERIGGVMMYNITNPRAPKFIQYINFRDFGVTPSSTTVNEVGDLGPEGMAFVPASDSPTGKALVIIGSEISGTTTVFEVSRGTTTSLETETRPVVARLLGNYPNPFNPATTVRFELGMAQQVKVQVVDQLGRIVRTLVDGVQAAGVREVRFDAAGLASGLYFVRLETATVVEVNKMQLIK